MSKAIDNGMKKNLIASHFACGENENRVLLPHQKILNAFAFRIFTFISSLFTKTASDAVLSVPN